MKQTSFETRERAAELIKETAAIWKQSNNSEVLEGLREDPVFNILMAALAHLANELEADIAHTVDNLWNEFAQEMLPYASCRPIPATIAVGMMPVGSAGEVIVDGTQTFSLHGDDRNYDFIPLLSTKVFGADVASIVRIDGRRWGVKLKFSRETDSLKGLTFAVHDSTFGDLIVSRSGREVPMISPCDVADMPYTAPFSLNTMLFNSSPMFNSSTATMDLFAKQNIRLYYIDDDEPLGENPNEVELVFEFTGISHAFVFDRSKLKLNVNILVNAHVDHASLSSEMPLVRVGDGVQLMHILPPESDQVFGDRNIRVFQTGGDRFNSATLLNLLHCIENHFHSDYCAFQAASKQNLDRIIYSISSLTRSLASSIGSDSSDKVRGTYIKLQNMTSAKGEGYDVGIGYVVTEGSVVNPILADTISLSLPAGLDNGSVDIIGTPVPASDDISDSVDRVWMAKYHMATGDRIVTAADVKIFCRTELAVRYGIVDEMVDGITVRRHVDHRAPCRYVIRVEIVLKDNRFVKKSFADRIHMVETLMENMIRVRSSNIYPIEVEIKVK